MDRYWRELDRQRRSQVGGGSDLAIECPLGAPPEHSRPAARPIRIWQKYLAYPWQVRRASARPGVKVVHVLDHSYAHLLAWVPPDSYKVATVHDLAPLRDGADLTPAQLARFRRTVEHLKLADAILAVSRYSASEAIALLGLSPEKVSVLPEGVDPTTFARPASEGGQPAWRAVLAGRRVVLSVGAVTHRKNLVCLPAVFHELGKLLPGVPLALLRVGAPLPAPLLDALRQMLGESGVVELGLVPDAELATAYRHADALIFPSRIEGFGFPVLEAMAAGCPVVCTNVTSLPEVGGEAALYFSPDDPRGAAAHLARLFTDERWRRDRVEQGRARSAGFSWETHYHQLLQIYRDGIASTRARQAVSTPYP